MNSLPKKIAAFIFLLIVAVPVCLSLKFIVEEILIQQEVDEKMNTEVLQSVRIPKADIIWIKAEKEILLDDKLFDVKFFTCDNDTVTLTGFFDDDETALVSAFKKYADANERENPLSELAFKFLFSAVYNSHPVIVFEMHWHAVSNQYHSFIEILPAAPSMSYVHPPQLTTSSFM